MQVDLLRTLPLEPAALFNLVFEQPQFIDDFLWYSLCLPCALLG